MAELLSSRDGQCFQRYMKYVGFAIEKICCISMFLNLFLVKLFLALVIFHNGHWNFTEVTVLKSTFHICIFGENVTV